MSKKIILASHGKLAEGLLDTCEMIVGALPCEKEVFSLLPGKLADDYAKQLAVEVNQRPDTEFVILTDIYGASVFSAMYQLTTFPNVKLFAGMNLPMLLAVAMDYPEPLTPQDAEAIIQEAQTGVRFVTYEVQEGLDEQEDF